MCEGLPEVPSDHAAEGTAAHSLGDTCLKSGKDAADFLGTTIRGKHRTFEVTEEMAEAVQMYLDDVRQVLARYPGMTLEVEQSFDLGFILPGMFGRNDASGLKPFEILFVWDYKHGAGTPVDVLGNSQLRYYGLGSLHLHPSPDIIVTRIVQPRCFHKDGPIREEQMTNRQLREWGEEVLRPAAIRTQDPNAPLVPGEKQCKWCKAAKPTADPSRQCPAILQSIQKAAGVVFDSLLPGAPLPIISDPATLPLDHLSRVLAFADMIDDWVHGVRDAVRHHLDLGHHIPGWKLVEGKKPPRSWKDEAQTREFARANGLDPDNRKLLSPAQFEKALKAAGFTPEIPKILLEQKPGRPSMVPETDPRPVYSQAEQQFTNLEEKSNGS